MASLSSSYHSLTEAVQRLFKLSDTDTKSTDLATEREDLDFILKSSVPGLVSSNTSQATTKATEETRDADRSATGHKLLVDPSVFNMGILLPPSLGFLTRLKDVVPSNADVMPSALTGFLDDFLINVFYPQLEDTLTDLSNGVFAELDAFREDSRWYARAQKPVFTVSLFLTLSLRFRLLTICRVLYNSSTSSKLSVACWIVYLTTKPSASSSSPSYALSTTNATASTKLS